MDTKISSDTLATTPQATLQHTGIELATLGYESRPVTAVPSPAPDVTVTELRREKIALAAAFWAQFMTGWNDGTLGPLIPRLQHYYNIGFIVVSMLFVSAFVGYITGAVLVVHLTDRYGFGRMLILGSVVQVVVYSILSSAPPFPVMCALLAVNGVGVAIQNAQTSALVMSMRNPVLKIGILQAGYGAGACLSPLAVTQFAIRARWSFFYIVSLGLAIINFVDLTWVFRTRTLPEVLETFGIPEVIHTADQSPVNKYRQIFSLRVVYILSFFSLVYVGTEVTIGGWIVTFLINTRGGGASTGYVSSGFFGGLMLGRLGLIWVNQKIGERRAIYVYAALTICLEFVIWFVPSLVANAVAVSVAGLLLGMPFYPILLSQSGGLLPAWLLTGAVSWILGCGQAGSAAFPFLTGMIAEKHGVQAMQPLIVSMVLLMILTWAVIPRVSKRQD